MIFLDLEGEDGDVPISLQDKSMALVNALISQAAIPRDQVEQVRAKYNQMRQDMIKEDVPPLAYLLSDVVVFVDTVEHRRKNFTDRVREFAEQAYKQVSSSGYAPALILVHNKWLPDNSSKEAAIDVTKFNDYQDMIQGLCRVFSSVHLGLVRSCA